MQKNEHRVEAIDLERVIFDPEYRRAVMEELRALRRAEEKEAIDDSAFDTGEAGEDDRILPSAAD
jgi:hypothetical protein